MASESSGADFGTRQGQEGHAGNHHREEDMSSLANGVLREPVSDKGRDIMNDQKRGESLQGRARPGNLVTPWKGDSQNQGYKTRNSFYSLKVHPAGETNLILSVPTTNSIPIK